MARPHDPARLERERMALLERRARARAEALAVAEGVSETVALSRARGAGFEAPGRRKGEREGPYRRLPGLDWLVRKGRLTAPQLGAGERYGAAYRRAQAEAAFGSSLALEPGDAPATGTPVRDVLALAEIRAQARAKLAFYRRRLGGQTDLVTACDLICGRDSPLERPASRSGRSCGWRRCCRWRWTCWRRRRGRGRLITPWSSLIKSCRLAAAPSGTTGRGWQGLSN